MSGLFNVLVIVAVVALAVTRQFSARRIRDEKRWWLLPTVLLLVALRNGEVVDPRHEALSAVLLVAGILAGLVTGAGWGWTSRVWRQPDASVWSRGTKATVFVWVGGIGVRALLGGGAFLLGVHQGPAALLLSLAAMLLARSGVLVLRARSMSEQHTVPAGAPATGIPWGAGQAVAKGRA
ncbi:DUF1453 domain-containing protein [Streptomyces sp. NPDC047737]|uniref:DUF1453 domain-containing protein n=1 Tax=Streptomyces sp. NPDC047737 TaxID=3155740 RepID=UPI0033CF33D7